jgi:putative PIG3 family NAD(P)H quinone oxidoreductase
MRAIEIAAPGGPEMLRLAERPIPGPAGREALIRVRAAGVNRPEILQRMGLYPPPPGASDIPGLECSGMIAAVGPDARTFRVGDAVCALLTGGGYADYAIADEGSILPAPAGLPLEHAGGLPEAVFTVFANVFDDAGLSAGETLLVHGGSSGVGSCAIALARAVGARVISTASSAGKLDRIRAMGADLALDYRSEDWDAQATAFGGADVVLDMAGGDFLRRNLSVLKPGGRHVSIAMQRGTVGEVDIFLMMRKRLRLSGSTMKIRSFEEKARLAAAIRSRIWPLIEAGKVQIPVERTFPLEAAADAHRLMESGGHVGKILLIP